MSDYLAKPFSPDDLSLALRRAVGGDVARIPSGTFRPFESAKPEDAAQEQEKEQALGELLRDL